MELPTAAEFEALRLAYNDRNQYNWRDDGYLPENLGVYNENRLLSWVSFQPELIALYRHGGLRNPIAVDPIPVVDLVEDDTSSFVGSAFASELAPVNQAVEEPQTPSVEMWEYINAISEEKGEFDSTARNYPPPLFA